MQRISPADSSLLNLPDLEALARETRFVARESARLTPSTFLQSLASAASSGLASLNQIAISISQRTGMKITSQAVHKRFSVESTAFLTSVAQQLFGQRFGAPALAGEFGSLRRILVEDSSVQAMHKSNAKSFPGHGNHHGSTSGVKIDFAYDLLAGDVVSHSLEPATEQDKSIGRELLAMVRARDLVLRDMGYFSISEFVEIERVGAFWLTRVPLTLGLRSAPGESLETVLKRTRGSTIDISALAGAVGMPCRLVAVRASAKVARQRRQQRREEARAKGREADPIGLLRDGWHLMITNLAAEEFPPRQLRAIYRARWGVEIQFRAWKQAHNLDKALKRKSGEHHLMAIILAAMINHLLGMRMARCMQESGTVENLSHEKLYDALSIHHQWARRWEDILDFVFAPKHVERDKRKRESPVSTRAIGLG
jgi:hypothetical protein